MNDLYSSGVYAANEFIIIIKQPVGAATELFRR
jgi:hypothetical protein